MAKRKTHQEFLEEMKSLNSSILILGKYVGAKTKILCECKLCNHKWSPTPSSLLTGRGCPICAKKLINKDKVKTQIEFVNELKNINENIIIVGTYINSTTKILCKCKIDNFKWSATPSNLLRGTGCPLCSGNMKMSHDDFELKMKEIHPNILLVGKYTNSKTKIRCKCLIDGYEWDTIPNNLLKGCGCHKCVNKARRTHDEFVAELKQINPNIEIRSRFKTVNSLVECFCIRCKNEFYSLPTNLLKGHGCSVCAYRDKTNKINNLKDELRAWIINWKKQSAKEWDYKCVITGRRFSHIHHLTTFDSIVKETFETLHFDIRDSTFDYEPYEVEMIKKQLINLHEKYGYGIPLISEIHSLFHQLYGYCNCTKRDMYDFVLRFINNEFDDYLIDNNISLNINEKLLKFLGEAA